MADGADEDVTARLAQAAELLERCAWRFWDGRNTAGIADMIAEVRACYDAVPDPVPDAATGTAPDPTPPRQPANPGLPAAPSPVGIQPPGPPPPGMPFPGAATADGATADAATANAATVALGRSTAAAFALRWCIDVDHGLNSGWDHDTQPPPLDGMSERDPRGVSQPYVQEAVSAARAALEADPDDPLAPLQLGHALAWRGDRDGAVAAYEKALWRDPWDGLARACLRTLRVPTPDPPPADLVRRRRHGFVLLRHSSRGSGSEWLTRHRLFGSVAAARTAADDTLRSSVGDLAGAEPSERLGLVLEVHRPSKPIARHDLLALTATEAGSGAYHIDWSTVPLDEPIEMPLPPGRMLRMGGETCFCYGTKAPSIA